MIAEKYPLQWPDGYPRSRSPKSSRFSNLSFAKARDAIFSQLKLMLSYNERSTIVLSTNIPLKLDGMPYATYRQPDDKGVAVYFLWNKESIVLCCDEWNKIEHNMWAIAKTIESLRGIERWGVSDFIKRSFTGFNALPPKQSDQEWWQIFKYSQKPGRAAWDWEGVKAMYKSMAKTMHPDAGGSVESFQILTNAFEQAKQYYGQ